MSAKDTTALSGAPAEVARAATGYVADLAAVAIGRGWRPGRTEVSSLGGQHNRASHRLTRAR